MTPGREESRKTAVVVSSGSGSGLISQVWSVCPIWRCTPPSESAEYDITIKDGSGNIIIQRVSQTGTISEECHLSLGIASSVAISNATVDGTYQVFFDMH